MSESRSTATAGYVILGLLGLVDALGFLLSGGDDGPPFLINLLGTIVGLVTLYALFRIFQARRAGTALPAQMMMALVITRILSALLGIPAFFVDIPGGIKVFVGVSILLTIVGLALIRDDVTAARSKA